MQLPPEPSLPQESPAAPAHPEAPAASDPGERGPSGPTGAGALAAVFFSPGALFERLKVHPVFGLAMVAGAISMALGAALVPAELAFQSMADAGVDLPGGAGALMKWFGVAGGFIGYLVVVLIWGGLLTLVFRFVLGDEATFRHYLSVAAYASLISAVGYLLVTPLRVMQGDIELDLSLGTFLPFIQEGYLARLLNGLGLFSIWAWIVTGLGVSVVGEERSWKSATAVVLLMGVGFVALFSLIPR